MDNYKYSDKEIIIAFKSFVVKVVKNASIDYARKVKSQKYKEVLFSECVKEKVSLSSHDNDIFFIENNNINAEFKEIISTLNPREKELLKLCIHKKSNKQIAEILNISEKTVRNRKTLLKNKLKERLCK